MKRSVLAINDIIPKRPPVVIPICLGPVAAQAPSVGILPDKDWLVSEYGRCSAEVIRTDQTIRRFGEHLPAQELACLIAFEIEAQLRCDLARAMLSRYPDSGRLKVPIPLPARPAASTPFLRTTRPI